MLWRTAAFDVPARSLLRFKEVAAAIGYSPRTLRTLIQNGIFPEGKPVGSGELRWSNKAVGAWLLWVEHCVPPGAIPGESEPEGGGEKTGKRGAKTGKPGPIPPRSPEA